MTTDYGLRLKHNIEAGVATRRLHLSFINSRHVAVRRTAFQRRSELIDCLRRAFSNRLDGAIGKIAYGSDDSGLSRRSNCKVAEADALNCSSDYESSTYRHAQKREA